MNNSSLQAVEYWGVYSGECSAVFRNMRVPRVFPEHDSSMITVFPAIGDFFTFLRNTLSPRNFCESVFREQCSAKRHPYGVVTRSYTTLGVWGRANINIRRKLGWEWSGLPAAKVPQWSDRSKVGMNVRRRLFTLRAWLARRNRLVLGPVV